MKCPACGNLETKVVDSRLSREGNVTRRRRECLTCGERFTTHERLEEVFPSVIKKDGSRQEFDPDKVRRGLEKAFEKRPISTEDKETLLANVSAYVKDYGEKEIPAFAIGEKVMNELKSVDEVAYVRFASVYRSFRDVNEFMSELTKLLKDKA